MAITRVYDVTPPGAAGSTFTFVTHVSDVLYLSGLNALGLPPLLLLPFFGAPVQHPAAWGTGANFGFLAARPAAAPGLHSHSERAIVEVLRQLNFPPNPLPGVPVAVIVHIRNIRRSCLNCYHSLANAALAPFLALHPNGLGGGLGLVPVFISVSHSVQKMDAYTR